MTARFELNEYDINLGTNDASKWTVEINGGDPKHGKRIELRAYPSLWYILQRWILNGNVVKTWDNQEYTWEILVIESLTWNVNLTGEFQAQQYSISYDLSGWELDAWKTNPTTYTVESAEIVLNNPKKTGYLFAWWQGTDLYMPTMEVKIPAWSRWDRSYYASWNSDNVDVKVYYYTAKLDAEHNIL